MWNTYESDRETAASTAIGLAARPPDELPFDPAVYVVTDSSGLILEASREAANLLGRAHDAVTGANLIHLLDPADPGYCLAAAHEPVPRLVALGDSGLRLCTFEGGRGRVEAAVRADSDGGERYRWLLRSRTGRRRTDTELLEVESRFNALAESAPLLLWMTDTECQCTYISPPGLQYLGGAMCDYLGDGWACAFCPEDHKRHRQHQQNALKAEQPFQCEVRLKRADGELRWVLSTGAPFYARDGRLAGLIGTCIDITERKQTRQALRENIALYDATFEEAPVGIAHTDPDGRWTRVNPRLCELLGYSEEELLAGRFQDFTHPDDVAVDLSANQDLIEGKIRSHTREKRYIRKDGSVFWALRTASLVRRPDGSPGHFVAIIEDITQRKKAQEALRQSEELNRILLASIPQRVFYKNRDSVFLSVNESFAADVGRHPQEIVGKTDFDLFPAHLAAKYQADDRRVMETRQPVTLEEHNIVQGRDRIVQVSKSPVINPDGEVIGLLGLFTDITERKSAEQALEESERRFRAIFQSAATGIALISLDGTVMDANPSLRRILRRTRHQLKGAEYTAFLHPEDRDRFDPAWRALLAGRRDTVVAEQRIMTGSDRHLWTNQTLSLVRDAARKPEFAIGMIEDVTERKRFEQQIREYSRELERQKQHLQDANTRLAALAITDGLTGLLNHRALHDRLEEEFLRARRYALNLSFILMDVDLFKRYNDTHGHIAGDEVLSRLGGLLRRIVRAHDTVARYGGEEFAIILPLLSVEQAMEAALRIQTEVAGCEWPEEPITVSIGIATLNGDMQEPVALLRAADTALYHSKHQGRNRFTHHRDLESA